MIILFKDIFNSKLILFMFQILEEKKILYFLKLFKKISHDIFVELVI